VNEVKGNDFEHSSGESALNDLYTIESIPVSNAKKFSHHY